MLGSYSVVIPERVDHHGRFITYHVTHGQQTRHKRSSDRSSSDFNSDFVFYKLRVFQKDFYLNLTLNRDIVSQDYIVEHWTRNGTIQTRHKFIDNCHFVGHMTQMLGSSAAISTCGGLVRKTAQFLFLI